MKFNAKNIDTDGLEILDVSSPNYIQNSLLDSERNIENMVQFQKYALAISFIQYFHENPDAILYISGNAMADEHSGDEECWWVARVDSNYVHKFYMDDEVFNNYKKSTYGDFFKRGKKDFGLPFDLVFREKLMVTNFDEFIKLHGLHRTWKALGSYSTSKSEDNGMVYSNETIRSSISEFLCEDWQLQEIVAMVERAYLKESIKSENMFSNITSHCL